MKTSMLPPAYETELETNGGERRCHPSGVPAPEGQHVNRPEGRLVLQQLKQASTTRIQRLKDQTQSRNHGRTPDILRKCEPFCQHFSAWKDSQEPAETPFSTPLLQFMVTIRTP